jgi:hypothetical protein
MFGSDRNLCGCCGGGGTGPTTGFAGCCPATPIPASTSLSWTFRAGSNAATYDDFAQNATLAYYAVGPVWTWTPGVSGPPGAALYGPVLRSLDGQDFYYFVGCSGASMGLGIGIAGFGPGACFIFGTFACSPFLVTGVGGGVGGVSCGYLGGFGAAGDNVVLS